MPVSAVPSGHNAVCPYLTASDAGAVIDFLKATFDAATVLSLPGPNGTVAHAELRIADSIVMIGTSATPMPGQVHCYVPDVDAAYERALAAGAASLRPPTDTFYGDRISMVKDRAGNIWAISTHKEDVSEEEMMKRMAAQSAG